MSEEGTAKILKEINAQFEMIDKAREIIFENQQALEKTSSLNAQNIIRQQIAYQRGVIRVCRLEIDRLNRILFLNIGKLTIQQTNEPMLLLGKFIGVTDLNSGHSVDIELKDNEIVFSLKNSHQTISWNISNAHVVDSIIGALQESRDQVFGSRGEI